ncbi:MAPKKK cascade protein kinase regulator Ste50, partial [Rasamsonia emersonii CBS 393.64]
ADQSLHETATHEDIARIVQSIRARDERLMAVEAELRKVTEDYRRLREELLPVFKMAKDRSQPLPYQPTGDHDAVTSPATNQTGGLARSHSRRVYNGGTTPKNNNSPTHLPQSTHDGRAYNDGANLDPSAAASSHLTASANGGGQLSPGMPSPTSPGNFSQQTLASRSYTREGKSSNSTGRSNHDHGDDPPQSNSTSARTDPPSGTSRPETRGGSEQSNAPSVEIFKSFRVSMDDPCHKVLPAALKKYNINADWRQYALYIVYGDQERCLGLDEKPLILFKQLDKEGKKPMFMLRKHAQPIDGSNPAAYPGGTGGSAPNSAGFENKPPQSQIQLPGGVL